MSLCATTHVYPAVAELGSVQDYARLPSRRCKSTADLENWRLGDRVCERPVWHSWSILQFRGAATRTVMAMQCHAPSFKLKWILRTGQLASLARIWDHLISSLGTIKMFSSSIISAPLTKARIPYDINVWRWALQGNIWMVDIRKQTPTITKAYQIIATPSC